MAAFAGSPAARPGDVTGTLRLLAYMALAIALIVLDHRGGWLVELRARGEMAVQPLWWLAGLPARVARASVTMRPPAPASPTKTASCAMPC